MKPLCALICLGVICLLSGTGCAVSYVLDREDALRIGAMSEHEYRQTRVKALREEGAEEAANSQRIQPVPVTVQAQQLDLKHGTWLDARRLRTSPKRPYDAIVPGIILLASSAVFAIVAGVTQFNERCPSRYMLGDSTDCLARDIRTIAFSGISGAMLAGGLVLTGVGIAKWSPEVSSR